MWIKYGKILDVYYHDHLTRINIMSLCFGKNLAERYKEQQSNIKECFNHYYDPECTRFMNFDCFVNANLEKLGFERCVELWSNDNIQFYCCNCFKKVYAI